MSNTIRVAAAQFHIGNDVQSNLDTCLRMMAAAAEHHPELLVLPEFCNHCSWYDGPEHCFEVSVDPDGEFLQRIASATAELGAYLVINCTLRREAGVVTGTSMLFGPDGALLGSTDKQVLIGHENDFLRRATEAGPIVDTPLGRLAMYSCMDGVINETPRCLALRGADVLCNSLNSFAVDEGTLHIPVRAAENKVWVVAANKVGPLIPESVLEPVSAAINIPADMLAGAGDSQIVAPDGTVIAIAGKGEEIIAADIEVALARDKRRPDGTDVFANRQTELYRRLGEDPAGQPIPPATGDDVIAAALTSIADIATARERGARIFALPSLVEGDDAQASDQLIDAIAAELDDNCLAACSLTRIIDGNSVHATVLISNEGVLLEQPLLHPSARYAWSATGDNVEHVDTPYGKIAVLCGDDVVYPETMRLAALDGVSTVLVCGDFLESWESRTGLVERSAENRVNVVAASTELDDCLVATLQKDFTIMTEWQERDFDGLLSAPEVRRSDNGFVCAEIHPSAASNKECSQNTHLLASRPWNLVQPITG